MSSSLLLLLILAPRPLLVTVDDLPIASGQISDRAERKRVTEEMLAALEKHKVRAVGLVTWKNVRDPSDVELLHRWLDAGHELGNHSHSHLDYTATPAAKYLADVELGRTKVQEVLDRKKQKLRFFRFPFLREGDTLPKLDAMRAYLDKSGQRNLPVTIDTQDWSFEEPWLKALRSADREEQAEIARQYQASLRSAVLYYGPLGDRVIGREVPQIILLHAGSIGASQWDELFTWLEQRGYRFATADEVLVDAAFAVPNAFVGPKGFSLWDRIRVHTRNEATEKELIATVHKQARDWNKGDVDTFCASYAEDATFISPSGITLGRQAIIDRYKKKYDTKEKMGVLSFDVLDVRLHQGWEASRAGDAVPSKIHGASIILRWTIGYPNGKPLTGLSLITLSPREAGGWVITQDASM